MKTSIKLITVRIKPGGTHFHLKTKINGVSARLVLDTGASRTVLGSEYLNKFKIGQLPGDSLPSAGIGGTNIDSYLCKLNEITLGNNTIQNYKVVAINLQHVNASYKNAGLPKVDGILGNDLLIKFNSIINLDKKTIELQRIKNSNKKSKK